MEQLASAASRIGRVEVAEEWGSELLKKAKEDLDEGMKILSRRQKMIKFADQSEAGWASSKSRGGHSGHVPPPPPPPQIIIYKFITSRAAFYNNSCTLALPIDTHELYYCTIFRAPRYAIIIKHSYKRYCKICHMYLSCEILTAREACSLAHSVDVNPSKP